MQHDDYTKHEEQKGEQICIIGGGPVGLSLVASLLDEAKNHPEKEFTITLLEKRSFKELNRRQKIIIVPTKLIEEYEKDLTNCQLTSIM